MNDKELWQKIINDISKNPRDFRTVTKNRRQPVWFHAKAEDEYILITNALKERPSSKLSIPRKIFYSDFKTVYEYYDKWNSGVVGIRDEVRKLSRNTAYIFALISYYNMTQI